MGLIDLESLVLNVHVVLARIDFSHLFLKSLRDGREGLDPDFKNLNFCGLGRDNIPQALKPVFIFPSEDIKCILLLEG